MITVTIVGVVLFNNVRNKTTIELIDNLDIEINSEVYLVSLIKKISNGEIMTDNYKIDTSKLGSQEIIVEYLDEKNRNKEYSFNINIVDTTPPTIDCNKELSTTVGTGIDLLNQVKVTDNTGEIIEVTVEGTYDFNKVGTYNLKYVAVDSSNNRKEENFNLRVDSITISENGYYVYKGSKEWEQLIFRGNAFEYNRWSCPGMACGGYNRTGSYTVDGNKMTVNIEATYGYDGQSYEPSETWKVTLINNTQVVIDNKTYIWQENDMYSDYGY